MLDSMIQKTREIPAPEKDTLLVEFLKRKGEPDQAKAVRVIKTYRDDPEGTYRSKTYDIDRPGAILQVTISRELSKKGYQDSWNEAGNVLAIMSGQERQEKLSVISDEEILRGQQGRFFVICNNGVSLRLQRNNFRGEEFLFKLDEMLKFPVIDGTLFVSDEYDLCPAYSQKYDIRSYRNVIREQLGHELPPTEKMRVDDCWATHLPYRDLVEILEAKRLLEKHMA